MKNRIDMKEEKKKNIQYYLFGLGFLAMITLIYLLNDYANDKYSKVTKLESKIDSMKANKLSDSSYEDCEIKEIDSIEYMKSWTSNLDNDFKELLEKDYLFYQHYICALYDNFEAKAEPFHIVLFCLQAKLLFPIENYGTATKETGNGRAGSGRETMTLKSKEKVFSNGHHGMKRASTFFTWDHIGKTVRNKQRYPHWSYAYATMDNRMRAGKRNWSSWQGGAKEFIRIAEELKDGWEIDSSYFENYEAELKRHPNLLNYRDNWVNN